MQNNKMSNIFLCESAYQFSIPAVRFNIERLTTPTIPLQGNWFGMDSKCGGERPQDLLKELNTMVITTSQDGGPLISMKFPHWPHMPKPLFIMFPHFWRTEHMSMCIRVFFWMSWFTSHLINK